MNPTRYHAFLVQELPDGSFRRSIEQLSLSELPRRDVLIRVLYSSLNYKDALSSSGNKGVTRRYPHTPGIDASGIVVESNDPSLQPGEEVIVTGYDLGMNTPGGFGEYISVPGEWVVRKPAGLSLEESMILGTAGFTAALAMHHLGRCGQRPEDGAVLVSGASGGVGCLAVHLLARQGFQVIAATGKPEAAELLRELGAHSIISRAETDDTSGKALLKPRWAGAIDTVGGNTLATILKACREHGNVAACGNVASPLLNTTVFPFILNGVNLLGVNSATTPMKLRSELWNKLASTWKPDKLQSIARFIVPAELDAAIREILNGKIAGRVVLRHQPMASSD